MAVSRSSRPASAVVRLLVAAALLAALIPAVDTRWGQPPTALAADFVVNLASDPGDGTCDATCTLRDAILNAGALAGHDTITFSPAVTTPIVLASALPTIAQALTIDGSGQAITVDGANAYRVFFATAPLTLTALTVQRGRAPNDGFGGGGAYFGSSGTLWGSSFISNTALGTGGGGAYFATTATLSVATFISNTVSNGHGGGAYVGGSAVVSSTAFMTNATNFNGGGLYVFATSTVTGSTFVSNTANASGGGAYFFGAAAVTGTTFIRNAAAVDYNASGGGALFSGAAALSHTTFMSNTAVLDGGGANFWGAGVAIRDSTFTGNAAGSGGGTYLAAGGGLTNTIFVSNTALADGGGLYLGGGFAAGAWPEGGDIAPITGATFTGNRAMTGEGGGAYMSGPAAISGSAFSGNSAASSGGGISAQAGTLVTGTQFMTNTAASGGGGIFTQSTSWFGVIFIRNVATAGTGGGALSLARTALDDVYFGDNFASGGGGGVRILDWATITNTTFYTNTAGGFSAHGGGASLEAGAVITGSTFVSNTARNGNGGGIFGSGITLTGTTVTGNQALCEDEQRYLPGIVTGPPTDCGKGGGSYSFGQGLMEANGIEYVANQADKRGGGAFLSGAQGVNYDLATFRGNTAGEEGGGAYLEAISGDWGRIEFSDNESEEAALFIDGSFLRLLNGVFARNEATNPNGAADIGMSFHDSGLDAKHLTLVPRFTGFQLAVSIGTDLPDGDGQQDTVAHLTNVIFHGYDVGVQGQAPTSTVEMTGVLWSNVNMPWQFGNFGLRLEYTGPAAFVDEAGGDLHLTAASAAIDRGVPTEVLTDFDDYPRFAQADLGAYEFRGIVSADTRIFLPFVVRE
jgi:predicted outer membrane repeat protein